MDTIKTYLDNMFASFPKTQQFAKLKLEILDNMEEKYNELKNSGKSENEAIGIVISEFGNIDELVAGMSQVNSNNQNNDTYDNAYPLLSQVETESYLRDSKKHNFMIALGVFFCIMGVATMLFTYAMFGKYKLTDYVENGVNVENEGYEILGMLPLFIFIAVAVGLFIFAGTKSEKYKFIEKGEFLISSSTNSYVKNEKERYQSTFLFGLIFSIILYILSPIAPIVSDIWENKSIGEFVGDISCVILLVIVAIATFIIINVCAYNDCFKKLLHEEEYSPKKKEEDRVIGIIASIVWPLTALVYLAYSFTTGGWGHSWIIWPVMGILFGVFTSVYTEVRKK